MGDWLLLWVPVAEKGGKDSGGQANDDSQGRAITPMLPSPCWWAHSLSMGAMESSFVHRMPQGSTADTLVQCPG